MNPSPLALHGFTIDLGERCLIKDCDFAPPAGSSTVIIGPTGVGKSVLLRAIAGLIPAEVFRISGSMSLHGMEGYVDGKKTGEKAWRGIRSSGFVFIPAETAQAMNPALTLDQNLKQLAPDSRDTIVRRLKEYFGLDFDAFARLYPDEVSGGELQRITLMVLLSRKGDLILLDEPTVNLDRNLRKRFSEFLNAEILGAKGKTFLMASHDLDFIQSLKLNDAYGIEASKLVRLSAIPRAAGFEKPAAKQAAGPGLEISDLSQSYFKRGIFGERTFMAFKALSIKFDKSTIYGITGPSGCGKSSMIRAILRLLDGTHGTIKLDGQDLVALKRTERGWDPAAFKPFRRKMAIVQQDSRFSFFPDLRVKDSFRRIEKALEEDGGAERLAKAMAKVGLGEQHLNAYPRSLSSGEMKRMDIARALAAEPEVLLLDEPFAHIDFETRAKVMKAISEYMAEHPIILIVVTHEDYDLRYFVEQNYDFPELVS